jgi:hypothetical protein
MGVASSRGMLAKLFNFCMSGKHRTVFSLTNCRILKNTISSAIHSANGHYLEWITSGKSARRLSIILATSI